MCGHFQKKRSKNFSSILYALVISRIYIQFSISIHGWLIFNFFLSLLLLKVKKSKKKNNKEWIPINWWWQIIFWWWWQWWCDIIYSDKLFLLLKETKEEEEKIIVITALDSFICSFKTIFNVAKLLIEWQLVNWWLIKKIIWWCF